MPLEHKRRVLPLFNLVPVFLFGLILIFVIPVIILDLTPPIARDALIHHLALPKLWIEQGRLFHLPWADFSYYPMNIDLLYLLPLYFKNDILPQFIHLFFGLGTGFLVFLYLKDKLGKNWGLIGFLIFFSTPIVLRLSTYAYVDLGMTFFITAGVYGFVQWKTGDYAKNSWFLMSAVSMGLALGSKYNALIAFAFMNLALVFCYARNTGQQKKALAAGVFFFLVAFLVASPWLIKNFLLTGNPVYPLFPNLFSVTADVLRGEASVANLIPEQKGVGLLQTRSLLYGENIWEILLLPLRVFFQGVDDSARYFDGALSFLLIVFLPFSLIRRPFRSDALLFISFSAFVILAAFFTEVIRVRYILPAVPFLSILSVLGIYNLYICAGQLTHGRKCIVKTLVALVVSGGVFLNGVYLKNYFVFVDPLPYLMKQETRDQFLSRHLASYTAIRYINDHLPENARVRLIFTGRRGYYLDRSYVHDPSFGMNMINEMVDKASDGLALRDYLSTLRFTHLLIREDLFLKYLRENFSERGVSDFLDKMASCTTLLYRANNYGVYQINPQNGELGRNHVQTAKSDCCDACL